MVEQDYLIHYGVKGMRWGVIRKRDDEPSNGRKKTKQPKKHRVRNKVLGHMLKRAEKRAMKKFPEEYERSKKLSRDFIRTKNDNWFLEENRQQLIAMQKKLREMGYDYF